MNTITDNSILLEEARMALKTMRSCGCDSEEGLETIDSYVNRVRTVCLSRLTDYVIENKLSQVHREVVTDYWFKNIPPAQTAQRLGLSLRGVYSARAKAQSIIKEYLEPLIMYFRDMPSSDIMPAVIDESLSVLRASKSSSGDMKSALKNIRLNSGAGTELAAEILGIDEKELIKKEKSHKEPALKDLKKYSRAFRTKIIIEFDNGNGEIKWKKH